MGNRSASNHRMIDSRRSGISINSFAGYSDSVLQPRAVTRKLAIANTSRVSSAHEVHGSFNSSESIWDTGCIAAAAGRINFRVR